MAQKKKLPANDRRYIEDRMAEICYYGTPEKGYADSGFWKYLSYVKTFDAHDYENPVKPLDVARYSYLQVVWLHMLNLSSCAFPKSRQLRMSWAACIFATWFARTAPHRLIVFQSKKDDDAKKMVSLGDKSPGVGRMDCIEQNLPWWLKDYNICSGKGNNVGELQYSPKPISVEGVKVPWYGSRVIAIPQGADQVRSLTASLYLGDEPAFWDDFEGTWTTVAPAIRSAMGNSKMFAFSSVLAGSGYNNKILESSERASSDSMYVEPENTGIPAMRPIYEKMLVNGQLPQGMRSWETPSGLPVLEIHYTADPDKRQDTEAGRKWLNQAASEYTGGVESPAWRREYEIDYGAMGGTLVFPELYNPQHPVFTPKMTTREVRARGMKIYAGYDFGRRHPSAFTVWGHETYMVEGDTRPRSRWHALWELYETCDNYVEHCRKIRSCPYFAAGMIEIIKCDPQMGDRNQYSKKGMSGSKTSMLKLFEEEGIILSPGQKGADLSLVELLKFWWSDPTDLRCFITSGCPNLQRELRGLKWEEHASAATASRKSPLEKIMDKNNDAFDSSAYVLTSRPKPADMPRRGSFNLTDYREEERRRAQDKEVEHAYVR